MARIVPGVQVTVVKDVVPQQLAPSGVLGLVGVTEKVPEGRPVQRASDWGRFVELFGIGTGYSLPEARQAIDNGVFQVVVSPVQGAAAATLSAAGLPFGLTARSGGTWANGLRVRVTGRKTATGNSFDLEIQRPGTNEWESHRQLTTTPGSNYVVDALASRSAIAQVSRGTNLVVVAEKPLAAGERQVLVQQDETNTAIITLVARASGPALRVKTETDEKGVSTVTLWKKAQSAADFSVLATLKGLRFPGSETALVQELKRHKDAEQLDFAVAAVGWPTDGDQYAFTGGADADSAAYAAALQRLKDEPDVDLVLAGVQDFRDTARLTRIYGDVISHCNLMAADCKGRIGFGQVPPGMAARDAADLGRSVLSDRFVLVAPNGTVGAVTGMVGSLPYNQSPTFKRVSGLGQLATAPGLDDQNTLVAASVATVAYEASKGLVVLRGLTTDGDQINVRRIADHAVRGVKMIGDLFIGTLNTEAGRGALKQKLTEFLLQMQKETAIVPSTDGSDPAFKVNVYSSQADFALGIVRVDLAVRPVRAIDYIYATIQIQT
jgi:hypothetical protein